MCPDASRTSDTICAYGDCTKKVWQDPDGSFSAFCGKTHMEGAVKLLQERFICKCCRTKPVYIEDGRKHDFCGSRCAIQYRNGPRTLSNRTANDEGAGRCTLPGCHLPAFRDKEGNVGRYCSQTHRAQAIRDGVAEPCLLCGLWPKNILNDKPSDFCSKTCANEVMQKAPVILEIPANTAAYQDVSRQFSTRWAHTKEAPPIFKIWKLYGCADHNNSFSRYKLAIERKTNLNGGNTRRRWHGTVRACRLGDSDQDTEFCGDPRCSLCSILRSSFELAKTGQRTNFGRFGAGIYTSATSSKANDYIWERGGSPYRAILLNEVIMGVTTKLTVDNPNLAEPPEGFDSVVGEPGGVLNYDESIVYRNDAIRPVYLILFKAAEGSPK